MLANFIESQFSRARNSKLAINQILLECRRQIDGRYSPEKEQAILAEGKSGVFLMVTQTKCRDAKAWIKDVLGGERSWLLKPTPIADMPDDIRKEVMMYAVKSALAEVMVAAAQSGAAPTSEGFMAAYQAKMHAIEPQIKSAEQKAAEKAGDKMTRLIEDQQSDGEWHKALAACISDVVEYPAAIMRASYARKLMLNRKQNPAGLQFSFEPKTIRTFTRIHPIDFFPAPETVRCGDGTPICIRLKLARKDMQELIGVPGAKDDVIREILDGHMEGQSFKLHADGDSEMAQLDKKSVTSEMENLIEGVEFEGWVPGKVLRQWGMDGVEDPSIDYFITAYMVGRRIIKAVIDPLQNGMSKFSSASFEPSNDSIWGKGVPQLIKGEQNGCNQAARSINDNVAIASGPLTEINKDRLADGQTVTDIYPWQVILTKDKNIDGGQVVRYYHAPMHGAELISVYEHWLKQADQQCGIPSFAHGDSQVGGAGNTASGLSMLMSASGRGVKQVIGYLNNDLITPPVELSFVHNMLMWPDESVKGDVQVEIKGTEALMMREQQIIRLNEFLTRVLSSEILIQILGYEGIAKILRSVMQPMEAIDTDDILPEIDDHFMERIMGSLAESGAGGIPNGQQAPGSVPLNLAGQLTGGQETAVFQQPGARRPEMAGGAVR
jgi:hypothetical protein